VARQVEPLEYYIRDEEKAVEEYAQLAEALSDHGRKDLAHVVFNIMVQEDQHRANSRSSFRKKKNKVKGVISMSPKVINIITNVIGALLFLLEPIRAYFASQPFNWVTFAVCIGGAIIAYFTSKSSTFTQPTK